MMAYPDLREDHIGFPVLQRLQECLCAELEKAGGPPLCYCGLMVGDIMPLDLVQPNLGDQGGVAWVRMGQAFISTQQFPAPDEVSNCMSLLALTIEIGVARCYPTVDPRRGSLDPQKMFEAARLYSSDMAAMRRAVACCLNDDSFYGSYSMGDWVPIPADGGISGGTWTVTVRPEA